MTGRNAPKTNVARSDVEQTPELNHALYRTYSIVAAHVQHEFDALVQKGIGITEAATEADNIRKWGLERAGFSHYSKYKEAISRTFSGDRD